LTFPPARKEIRGNAGARSLSRRLRGFKAALEARGIPDVVVTFGNSRVDAGDARKSLLAHHWDEGHPEVVVCLSDAQAAGVYEYAERKGLRIPEDLSVTGFDGSLVLEHLRPRLTTVRQPGFLKGRLAAELMEALWKDSADVKHLVVKAQFIAGASLGYPRRTGEGSP